MPTVLIVDDDPAIREALAEAVTDLGHRAACAADGNAALCWLDQHRRRDGRAARQDTAQKCVQIGSPDRLCEVIGGAEPHRLDRSAHARPRPDGSVAAHPRQTDSTSRCDPDRRADQRQHASAAVHEQDELIGLSAPMREAGVQRLPLA